VRPPARRVEPVERETQGREDDGDVVELTEDRDDARYGVDR
jgi:hypothetical protein